MPDTTDEQSRDAARRELREPGARCTARRRGVGRVLTACAWIGTGVPLGYAAGWLSGVRGQHFGVALAQAACVTMSLGAGAGVWRARRSAGLLAGAGDGVTLGMPLIVGWLLACGDLGPVWAQARSRWLVVLPLWATVCGLGLLAFNSVRADRARADKMTKDDEK